MTPKPSWELGCAIIRQLSIALKNRTNTQVFAATVWPLKGTAGDFARGARSMWSWVSN